MSVTNRDYYFWGAMATLFFGVGYVAAMNKIVLLTIICGICGLVSFVLILVVDSILKEPQKKLGDYIGK